jgi:hypothetical protein
MDARILRRPPPSPRSEDVRSKDAIEFYLEDVMLHGTADKVVDQIRAPAESGMTYLMAAPLSQRSFTLLTDKVLPQIAR